MGVLSRWLIGTGKAVQRLLSEVSGRYNVTRMSADYTTALKPARPQADLLPNELNVIVHLQFEGKQQRVVLKRRRTTFGRGDADVVIPDATMSRKHFQLEVVRGGVVLSDLASANGTIYRGRWITYANLKDGDSFQAGNTRFHISIRTTNLSPARLGVLIALEGEEGGALARVIDSETCAVRNVDPNAVLEICRAELPDIAIVDGTARELATVENLKRLPRLKHTRVIVLLSPDNAFLEERFRLIGADEVLLRPLSGDGVQTVLAELATSNPMRELNFPATLRCEGLAEVHARLTGLAVLSGRLKVATDAMPPVGAPVQLKLLLPNEYGVVVVRGTVDRLLDDEVVVAFTFFEGNGQIIVRRILRDLPLRLAK